MLQRGCKATNAKRNSGLNSRRTFHTSTTSLRFGQKNRKQRKRDHIFQRKNFWDSCLGRVDTLTAQNDRIQFLGEQYRYFYVMNYPTYDSKSGWKNKPKVTGNTDISDWEFKYYRMFPEEKLRYPVRNVPEARQWFIPPVERFLNRLTELRTVHKFEEKRAWAIALQEKAWEEQAVQMEMEISRRQAEVLFGIESRDYIDEIRTENRSKLLEESDPRIIEKYEKLQERPVLDLIQARQVDPKKPKIKPEDVGKTWRDIMNFLMKYPEHKDHFDESVYYGESPIQLGWLQNKGKLSPNEIIENQLKLSPEAKKLALKLIPLIASLVGLKKMGKLGEMHFPGTTPDEPSSDPFAMADLGRKRGEAGDEAEGEAGENKFSEEMADIMKTTRKAAKEQRKKDRKKQLEGVAGVTRPYTSDEVEGGLIDLTDREGVEDLEMLLKMPDFKKPATQQQKSSEEASTTGTSGENASEENWTEILEAGEPKTPSTTPVSSTPSEPEELSLKEGEFSMESFLGEPTPKKPAQKQPAPPEEAVDDELLDINIDEIDLSKDDVFAGLSFEQKQKKAQEIVQNLVAEQKQEKEKEAGTKGKLGFEKFAGDLFEEVPLHPDVKRLSQEEILMGAIMKEIMKRGPEGQAMKPGDEVMEAMMRILFPRGYEDEDYEGMMEKTEEELEELAEMKEEEEKRMFHVSENRVRKIVEKLAEKDSEGEGVYEVMGVLQLWSDRVDKYVDQQESEAHLERVSQKLEPILFEEGFSKVQQDPARLKAEEESLGMHRKEEEEEAGKEGGKLKKLKIRSMLMPNLDDDEDDIDNNVELQRKIMQEQLEALRDPKKAAELERKENEELDELEESETQQEMDEFGNLSDEEMEERKQKKQKKKKRGGVDGPLWEFDYDKPITGRAFGGEETEAMEGEEGEERDDGDIMQKFSLDQAKAQTGGEGRGKKGGKSEDDDIAMELGFDLDQPAEDVEADPQQQQQQQGEKQRKKIEEEDEEDQSKDMDERLGTSPSLTQEEQMDKENKSRQPNMRIDRAGLERKKAQYEHEEGVISEIDKRLSRWSLDLLKLYSDKVNVNELASDEQEKEELMKQGSMAKGLKAAMRQVLGDAASDLATKYAFENMDDHFNNQDKAFRTQDEVFINKSKKQNPFMKDTLQEELNRLMKDIRR